MESLAVSLNAIIPMTVYMLFGVLLKKRGVLNDATIGGLNSIVYNLLLPVNLFVCIYRSDFSHITDTRLIVYILVSVTLNFLLATICAQFFNKNNRQRAVIVASLFRGNTAIYGFALAERLLGSNDNALINVSLASAMILFNIYGTISMECYKDQKKNLPHLLKQILLNPMIIAVLLSFIAKIARIDIPDVLWSPLDGIASALSPMAFLVLGASFSFKFDLKQKKLAAATAFLRLIAVPLVWVSVGLFALGFRGESLIAIVAVFATPTAAGVFSISKSMGMDSELAADVVVYTSLFSLLTLLVLIFVLKSFALF